MRKRVVSLYNRKGFALFRSIALIFSGTALIAFGTGIFIIPFNLVFGGVSGIAILLEGALSRFSLFSSFSAELYASALNILLFLIGFFVLGREFAAKTLLSALFYPLILSFSSHLVSLGGFFALNSEAYHAYGEISILLASVFGGAVIGAGCALTLLGGGSSGGIDVAALIFNRLFPRIKSTSFMFIIDAIIVALGVLVFKSLVLSLLGLVSALICAVFIDRLFPGGGRAIVLNVISTEHKSINSAIISDFDRTTTLFEAVGGYSGDKKKVLVIIIPESKYHRALALINEIDPLAFVHVYKAYEVMGEGWIYKGKTSSTEKHIESKG